MNAVFKMRANEEIKVVAGKHKDAGFDRTARIHPLSPIDADLKTRDAAGVADEAGDGGVVGDAVSIRDTGVVEQSGTDCGADAVVEANRASYRADVAREVRRDDRNGVRLCCRRTSVRR